MKIWKSELLHACQAYVWIPFLGMLLCSTPALAPQGRSDRRPSEDKAVHVQMHNVMYHCRNDVAVHIRRLGGELVPNGDHLMPIFDDKESFTLRVAAAEVAIRPDSLAHILNDNVFAGDDSPVKDISVTIDKNR